MAYPAFARQCIEQFLHPSARTRRSLEKVSQRSDCLFIGLVRLDPLQVPEDLTQGLLQELRTPPRDAQSITPTQQRVLDLLAGKLGDAAEETEERMQAGWHRAPFEELLALTEYAQRFPAHSPFHALATRLTQPGRITDRLAHAKLSGAERHDCLCD